MISFNDYLYQGEEIQSVHRQINEHRLVHALMITGEPGTGKKTLAFLIARALLCQADHDIPCGHCEGCVTAASGEHPDLTVIEKGIPLSSETSKGRSTIPVEDIREMIRQCSRFAYEGGNRVIVIPDAENMTIQAQNSLLKILEEPPANTYFLLTSGRAEQILTTVRSRCRMIRLVPWETDYISKQLTDAGIDPATAIKAASVSGGSIGNAFRLAADDEYWKLREEIMNAFFRNRNRSSVLGFSTAWKDRKTEAPVMFEILEQYVHQLLRYRLYKEKKDFPDTFPEEWQAFAASADMEKIMLLQDGISAARQQCEFNVNFQAVIERLLLLFIGEGELWQQ